MFSARELRLIDGATGSELERRGVDLSLPLWSTRALIDAPEVLKEVHRDYLLAGAQAITTATFRTHRRSLEKAGLGSRASDLTQQAVELARKVRDEVRPEALVLGSVAPLEDCYRPDLAPAEDVCRVEHGELIKDLSGAGVDLILIETMNNIQETLAAIEAAQKVMPGRWMVSFCFKQKGDPGIFLSGEKLIDIASKLENAAAVGINCMAAPAIESQVRFLRRWLPSTPVLAYGNIGHADPSGNWISSDAVCPEQYGRYVATWIEAGVDIIGGCCGTTPEHIRAAGVAISL